MFQDAFRKYLTQRAMVLSLGLALMGCSATTMGPQSGFVYRTLSGEFICARHPSKSEWAVSKEALDIVKHLPPLELPAVLIESMSSEERRLALKTYIGNMENLGKAVTKVIVTQSKPFPEPNVLAKECRILIDELTIPR